MGFEGAKRANEDRRSTAGMAEDGHIDRKHDVKWRRGGATSWLEGEFRITPDWCYIFEGKFHRFYGETSGLSIDLSESDPDVLSITTSNGKAAV
jgi:hypothetical protein